MEFNDGKMTNLSESALNISSKYKLVFPPTYIKLYLIEIEMIFSKEDTNIEDLVDKLDLSDKNILNLIGIYCQYVTKNYDLMKKYYEQSIEKLNPNSMFNLGNYYGKNPKERDFDKTIKYYNMALDTIHKINESKEPSQLFEIINSNDSDDINSTLLESRINSELGLLYITVLKNYPLGVKHYLQAIELGNVKSIRYLGEYYQDIEENYDLAIKYYKQASEKGDLLSNSGLGNCYYHLENLEEAKKYYEIAIKGSDDKAMYNLGSLYEYAESDINSALKYYLMSSEKGNISAIFRLASYYDMESNNELAEKYYLEGINKGHIDSMIGFSQYFKNKNDTEKMIKYLEMACSKSSGIAMGLLGNYYESIKNLELTKKYYLMGANNGIPACMFNIGLLYQKERKFKEALKYYLMAAEHGEPNSFFSLGLYYETIEPNDILAKKYYLESAKVGNSDAMFRLGVYYLEVEQNKIEGKKHLEKASELGSIRAIKLLIRELEKEYDVPNLIKYRKILSDKGDTESMIRLAIYYSSIYNFSETKKYLGLAIELGNPFAMFELAEHYESIEVNLESANSYYLKCFENVNDPDSLDLLVKRYLMNHEELDLYKMLIQGKNTPMIGIIKRTLETKSQVRDFLDKN